MKQRSTCPPGPLMIDLVGTGLTPVETEQLCDPRVGGLILFSRNFQNLEQLIRLVAAVREIRPNILIAVDHEGGRVQRFREGFTRLPSMRILGQRYQIAPQEALEEARLTGWVLGMELRRADIDLSFTPVLDLDYGGSHVIGDRSFHRNSEVVITLARALTEGLANAGMSCVGKHFPGHGYVEADSHTEMPVDEREWDDLQDDIRPFRELKLGGVMPAHVVYSRIDPQTAGFSPFWLNFLRQDLAFDGVIFSDDLSMEGASVAGGVTDRVEAAWAAGCDMLLLCNRPDGVATVLREWFPDLASARVMSSVRRIQSLRAWTVQTLGVSPRSDQRLVRAQQRVSALAEDNLS